MKRFSDLSEQEVLALAISNEDEDSRIYRSFAQGLREPFPASAKVVDAMADEESRHRSMLFDLYRSKFGEYLPLIRRQDVKGFIHKKPLWLMQPLKLDEVRKFVETMEYEAERFYRRAAETQLHQGTRLDHPPGVSRNRGGNESHSRSGAVGGVQRAGADGERRRGGRARDWRTQPQLYVSIQADEAWGPPPAAYRGAERDFQDFPFMQVLAISSYPYFFYPDPDQVPLDYYVRVANGRSLPIMVVEGGWTSASVNGSIQSSPQKEAKYLRRQERMLDSARAIAVFQLTYTDLDISAYQPLPANSILPLFASLGHVDVNLSPKASLATYDSIFARPLKH